ncbi:hypothetical protein [Pandoraea captiosa]|uniref:hypothetical protein n=1 Tax=Pandoraea captiosa TaxID=2508302 RepID=UPI001583DB47|nr:hypothetical protein [Pandoraea captiosa]
MNIIICRRIVAFLAILSFQIFSFFSIFKSLVDKKSLTARILASTTTTFFCTSIVFGILSLFAAGFFFIKMINSPQPGKSIFGANGLTHHSLISDDYLNSRGKLYRTRTIQFLLIFGVCWLAGVTSGITSIWIVNNE